MTHTSYPYIIRFVRSKPILKGGEGTREREREVTECYFFHLYDLSISYVTEIGKKDKS